MPTIVAAATPPGVGGIGIIRLSGPGAKTLLGRVFLPHSKKFINFRPWVLHRGVLLDVHDSPLDDVLAVFMPGPRTYTGEDIAEVHCHGGPLIMDQALESFLRLGARLANPGEFTRRAYLNGRLDLSQAEAIAEMISAQSKSALSHGLGRLEGSLSREVIKLKENVDELRAFAKIGIDFPDDEIEGFPPGEMELRIERIITSIDELLKGADRASLESRGAVIALCGPVNVGKSSLLNALFGQDRALVTALPGTTRDYIEITMNLDGLPVRLIDTAGLRGSLGDEVERLGMEKTRVMAGEADLLLLVLDASADAPAHFPLDQFVPEKPCLLVWNKIDLGAPRTLPNWAAFLPSIQVSALTGKNVDGLAARIRSMLLEAAGESLPEGRIPPNTRQAQALRKAREELRSLLSQLAFLPYDCCLSHLDEAAACLASIFSLATDDELLDKIFSNFCIGK